MHTRIECGVDKRMIEEAKSKLDAKDRAHRAIQIRLRQRAFVHAIDQRLLKDIVSEVVKLHVDAGTDGHTRGIFGRRSHMMHRVKTLDGAQVGENEALEAPFVAKNRLKQERVCCDRDAIDLVISSHGGHRVAFTKRGLEGLQHDHAQFALADMHRRSIGAAFGRPMSGEVLRLGHNGVVGVETVALRATHVGEAQLTGEVRIFAEILFNAPPAGLASNVKNRRQDHVNTGGARLCRNGSASLLGDLGIPGGSKVDGRGKNRAGVEAVQALLDEEGGNAETIVCDHPALDGVGLLRCGVEIVDGAHSQVAPEALRLLRKEDGIECRMCIVCVLVHDFASAGVHIQLPRLLLERHATHQVVDAGLEWRVRLLIQRAPDSRIARGPERDELRRNSKRRSRALEATRPAFQIAVPRRYCEIWCRDSCRWISVIAAYANALTLAD